MTGPMETKTEKVWITEWSDNESRTVWFDGESRPKDAKEATLTYQVPKPKGVTRQGLEHWENRVRVGNASDSQTADFIQRIIAEGIIDPQELANKGAGVKEIPSKLLTRDDLAKAWDKAVVPCTGVIRSRDSIVFEYLCKELAL